MADASFFTNPQSPWQRRYEALRASFVDGLPASEVAARFGFTESYVNFMRHEFRHGRLLLAPPTPEQGASRRRSVPQAALVRILALREQRLSAAEISRVLEGDGMIVSPRTITRVLKDEGREHLAPIPAGEAPAGSGSRALAAALPGGTTTDRAALMLFAPFVRQLGLADAVKGARLPVIGSLSAEQVVLGILGVKLAGPRQVSHRTRQVDDRALALFAGLQRVPNFSTFATHARALGEDGARRIDDAVTRRMLESGLVTADVVNIDVETVPWPVERHGRGSGAKTATIFAQDGGSGAIFSAEPGFPLSDPHALADWIGWAHQARRPSRPQTFVFDARLCRYDVLSVLDSRGSRFVTERRRAAELATGLESISNWQRFDVPALGARYPGPEVSDSTITLPGYHGPIRQLVLRGSGRTPPAFLITNDMTAGAETVLDAYARRLRIAGGIADAVALFALGAPTSPLAANLRLDITLTRVADALYRLLARAMPGQGDMPARTLFRDVIAGPGLVDAYGDRVVVTLPRRPAREALTKVPWPNLPMDLPGGRSARLEVRLT